MNQKLVSQLDENGFFVAAVFADESPLEPGVYLLPGGAIDAQAPAVPDGKRIKWVGEWVFEDIPQPTPEIVAPAAAPTYSLLRSQAYRDESDPLFFQEQRGEVPPGTWLEKVAEIKARWPE